MDSSPQTLPFLHSYSLIPFVILNFLMPLLLPSTLPQGLKMKAIRDENVARWYTNYLVCIRLRVPFSV